MKKILITGADSYIGTSFEKYMQQFEEYTVDTVDMREETWRDKDFSVYDAVFHVAGIAHIKETTENASLYYKVNRDLAIETAKKTKESGVGVFVLLSSMSVYGKETGEINCATVPAPTSNYGKSKFEADETILQLADYDFRVAVLRPPMVYGKGCKGNYKRLSKLAKKTCAFPWINNERSMIYIENLCEFVRHVIDKCQTGIYFPQDKEYCCTSQMVEYIADCAQKKVIFMKIFNPIIRCMNISVVQKLFGNLVYEKVDYGFDYHVVDALENAIKKSEGIV